MSSSGLDKCPPTYYCESGSAVSPAQLQRYLKLSYREQRPQAMDSGLEAFVAQFLARDHRIWWAISASPEPVGCLWLGYTVDPVTGDRHPYVFLLHVLPAHRRQGIGRSLMQIAEAWATQQGYRKLSLHVFDKSAEARQLYQGLGYQSQSILMAKNL